MFCISWLMTKFFVRNAFISFCTFLPVLRNAFTSVPTCAMSSLLRWPIRVVLLRNVPTESSISTLFLRNAFTSFPTFAMASLLRWPIRMVLLRNVSTEISNFFSRPPGTGRLGPPTPPSSPPPVRRRLRLADFLGVFGSKDGCSLTPTSSTSWR